jgi:hypothetical protein
MTMTVSKILYTFTGGYLDFRVNGNHWAYFHGHYLFLHEDKYYMRNKNKYWLAFISQSGATYLHLVVCFSKLEYPFLLDQLDWVGFELDFYNSSLLKQTTKCRYVAPLWLMNANQYLFLFLHDADLEKY